MSIKRYGVEGGTGTGGQHLHVRAGGGSGRLAVRFRPDADEKWRSLGRRDCRPVASGDSELRRYR